MSGLTLLGITVAIAGIAFGVVRHLQRAREAQARDEWSGLPAEQLRPDWQDLLHVPLPLSLLPAVLDREWLFAILLALGLVGLVLDLQLRVIRDYRRDQEEASEARRLSGGAR